MHRQYSYLPYLRWASSVSEPNKIPTSTTRGFGYACANSPSFGRIAVVEIPVADGVGEVSKVSSPLLIRMDLWGGRKNFGFVFRPWKKHQVEVELCMAGVGFHSGGTFSRASPPRFASGPRRALAPVGEIHQGCPAWKLLAGCAKCVRGRAKLSEEGSGPARMIVRFCLLRIEAICAFQIIAARDLIGAREARGGRAR